MNKNTEVKLVGQPIISQVLKLVDKWAAKDEDEKSLFNGGNYGKNTPGKHVGRA